MLRTSPVKPPRPVFNNEQHDDPRKLHVGNLPADVDMGILHRAFSNYGKCDIRFRQLAGRTCESICASRLATGSADNFLVAFAIITFATAEDARQAVMEVSQRLLFF